MVDYSNKLYQEDLQALYPYLAPLVNGKDQVRLLITGATGLVGSFLVDAVRAFNKKDNNRIKLYLTTREKDKIYQRFPGIEQEEVVILKQDLMKGFPDEQEYDYIVHLASNADPAAYAKYPLETIETNVVGAIRLVQYLRDHPGTKAVVASSMEVYGQIEKEPIKEADFGKLDFNMLRAGYPESKRTAELILRSAVEEYQIQCMIARLGYLYGPTMQNSDNKIVSELIRKAKQKKSAELKTPGVQRRTYCYVRDAVSALLQMLRTGRAGEVYNVADRKSETTIRGLAELVCRLYGLNLTIQDQSISRTNTNVILDSSKLEETGWRAEVPLEDGIQRSVSIWKL